MTTSEEGNNHDETTMFDHRGGFRSESGAGSVGDDNSNLATNTSNTSDDDDFFDDRSTNSVGNGSINSRGGASGLVGGLLKKKPNLRNPFANHHQRQKQRQQQQRREKTAADTLAEEQQSDGYDMDDDDDDEFDESLDLGILSSHSPKHHQNKHMMPFDPRKVVESVSTQVTKTMTHISAVSGHHSSSSGVNDTSTKLSVSEIEKLAQKRGANTEVERFSVVPSYAYPKTKFNREELRQEMNKPSSYYHDLRPAPLMSKNPEKYTQPRPLVGYVNMEILQCFGIPKAGVRTETSAFCVIVCQDKAFKTDTMPHVANPMWLSKMRRACIFPLYEAYARVYLGVFGRVEGNSTRDVFIGRVVLDLARLRPGSTYDVTLPLRQSNQVYARQRCGSIRFRIHLTWLDERAALLSYLPRNPASPQFEPHDTVTIKCLDNKSFQNVVRTVHGHDCPGKFSMKLTKATMREFNFVRVYVMRYLRKREIRDITQWRYPFISFFVFASWSHSVYVGSMKYVPGHLVTYLVLILFKNYSLYVLDAKYDNGFSMPTWEELMTSLLFGRPGSRHIEPLEMERKDPGSCLTAATYFDDDDQNDGSFSASDHQRPKQQKKPTLDEVANEFRNGVKRSGRRRGGEINGMAVNTFTGTDAVDFLVFRGYAPDRAEAVELGRRLQQELHLFEHIRRRQEFNDDKIFYSFLNYDTSEYVFKTHRPWFKNVSRMLGLYREDISTSEAHMEFPFASGIDHPRFTIKDSLVIRSRESRNAMARMDSTEDDDDNGEGEDSAKDIGESSGHAKESGSDSAPSISFDGSLYPDQNMFDSALFATAKGGDDDSGFESDANDNVDISVEDNIEIKILPKPPNQDMLFVKKADKPIPEALMNTKNEIHRVFGHLFHDKAYKLPIGQDQQSTPTESKMDEPTNASASPRSKNRKFGFSSKKNGGNGSRKKDTAVVKIRKDEYDKLLHSAKFSTNNVITSKVAVIVQPIIELVQLFLSIMRAQFNVLTWRDPFLTFWVSTFLIVLVPILHMFPWRLVLGATGLVLVGPQNWLFRILREQKIGGPEPDEFDIIKKRKKIAPPNMQGGEEPFYFSSLAPDNRPILNDELDKRPETIKEVAIPHSQLIYRRCYDWPPEPEYARVWKCDPPRSDPEAQMILEGNRYEMHDGSGNGDGSGHGPSRRRNYPQQSSNSSNTNHNHAKLNQRARQVMTGVKSKLRRQKS